MADVGAGAASGAAAGSAFGPWGALAGGVIGAGSSLMGASKSSKAAGKAMDQQQQMALNDLALRQQLYNRYMGLMGPTEEKLAAESRSTEPLDYAQNAAKIKQNYAQALRNINTSMGLRGIAGSGLDTGALRGAALQQAGDLSGAYAQGLQNRRNLGLALTGRGQIQQSAGNVMGGMQNLSNLYGGQANMFNQAAAQGWQNFGTGLQNIAMQYGMRSQQPEVSNLAGLMQNARGSIQQVPVTYTMPQETLESIPSSSWG